MNHVEAASGEKTSYSRKVEIDHRICRLKQNQQMSAAMTAKTAQPADEMASTDLAQLLFVVFTYLDGI